MIGLEHRGTAVQSILPKDTKKPKEQRRKSLGAKDQLQERDPSDLMPFTRPCS